MSGSPPPGSLPTELPLRALSLFILPPRGFPRSTILDLHCYLHVLNIVRSLQVWGKLFVGSYDLNPFLYLSEAGTMLPALCVCSVASVPCLTLCDPVDCSPPGSSVHGILQAGILEWVAVLSSRIFLTQGSNPCLFKSSALAGRFFTPTCCLHSRDLQVIDQLIPCQSAHAEAFPQPLSSVLLAGEGALDVKSQPWPLPVTHHLGPGA